VDYPCQIERKPPYVCNACSKTYSCLFDKYLYSADHAHREYVEELHESRKGIDLTKDELIELDELVSPLIMKGQPISHIFAEHADEIPCSERTLYNYIEKRYLSVGNLDLRRKVRYKKRKHEEEVKPSPRKKINHHYKDFLCELEENPGVRVVEMDTVIGSIGGKVLQTIYWRGEKLMLAFLLDSKEQSGTAGTFDRLETLLGLEDFRRLFPVVLTDNGSEFADFKGIEEDLQTTIYFADPHSPWQRGLNENTNDMLRFFFPKGTDFSLISEDELLRVVHLINSRPRKCLDYISPLDFISKKCCT
jgi:IS30 family transposase